MACRRSRRTRFAQAQSAALAAEKKTPALSGAFDALFALARGAFGQERVFERARALAHAGIVSLGRRTITGLLATCGRQFEDWSAAYRLFERARMDFEALWRVPLGEADRALPADAPFFAVLDDTHLPRRGRKVAAAAWRHDPLGPPFAHQIVWAQRALEIAALLPAEPGRPSPARAVPVDLALQSAVAPCPKKATAEQRHEHEARRREASMTALGAARLAALRRRLDSVAGAARRLVAALDGGYTNKALFQSIPPNTTLVGRIRKDAKLFAPPPDEEPGAPARRGRRRLYGPALAAPEALLKDDTVAWQTVRAFAAGREREFQCKTIERCRWARGSGGRDMRLVVIRPLSAHPHESGRRLFFAHPGYLICSDPALDLQQIVQIYTWRWEIEVGFREQKTQFGLGQAQVRTQPATTTVLGFQAFTYALVLLAGRQSGLAALPRPKWQNTKAAQSQRITFGQLTTLFRAELWGRALGLDNKTHFASSPPPATKSLKIQNTLQSAVLYATP